MESPRLAPIHEELLDKILIGLSLETVYDASQYWFLASSVKLLMPLLCPTVDMISIDIGGTEVISRIAFNDIFADDAYYHIRTSVNAAFELAYKLYAATEKINKAADILES